MDCSTECSKIERWSVPDAGRESPAGRVLDVDLAVLHEEGVVVLGRLDLAVRQEGVPHRPRILLRFCIEEGELLVAAEPPGADLSDQRLAEDALADLGFPHFRVAADRVSERRIRGEDHQHGQKKATELHRFTLSLVESVFNCTHLLRKVKWITPELKHQPPLL